MWEGKISGSCELCWKMSPRVMVQFRVCSVYPVKTVTPWQLWSWCYFPSTLIFFFSFFHIPSINIDFYWKVGNRGDTGVAEACYLCSLGISVKRGRFRILAVFDVSSRFRSSRAQFYNGQKLRGLPIYGLRPHYLIYTLVSLSLLIESYPCPSSLEMPPGGYQGLLL